MFKLLQFAVQEILGQLSWDLPAQRAYTPGTELPFTLQVTNPTTAGRLYKIQVQAIVQGQLVWYADLLLEGQTDVWFSVPAGKAFTIQGVFSADQTDFTLKALLIDFVTNQVLAGVSTDLVGATQPPPPSPTPPPSAGFDLAPLMSVMSLVMVMGLMSSLTGMFKKE